MSRPMSRRIAGRWLLAAVLIATAALPIARAADAPSAPPTRAGQPATDLCTWPLIGAVTTTSTVSTAIPTWLQTGVVTDPYAVAFTLSLDHRVLDLATRADAASFAGTLTSHQRVVISTGATSRANIAAAIPPTAFPAEKDSTAPLEVRVAGNYARVRMPVDGRALWLEDDMVLNITLYDEHGVAISGLGSATDSDHDLTSFDVVCTRPAGARTVADALVAPEPPVTPTPSPAPTIWAIPPAPGPALTLSRLRKLTVHALRLDRTTRHGCPDSVDVRVRPTGKRAPTVTSRMQVRSAFVACTVDGAIRLDRRFIGRTQVDVRFRAAGVGETVQTVTQS